MGRELRLNKGILTFNDEDGKSYYYNATTGRVGNTDPKHNNSGPIPSGKYTLYPKEVSVGIYGRSIIWSYFGDWGKYRVPLHPNPGTDVSGYDGPRQDFFLHGGSSFGSAGCIDVGDNDVELFPLIMKSNDSILVTVTKYPNTWSNSDSDNIC
ncbi:hypothetical protein SRRS_11960 [Sporomusa rhizae]|uniref:L,D-transpeptidase family protein n=1 Tax=Sporomusa rhizae TaxID=357999 RepID=UPI00352B3C66